MSDFDFMSETKLMGYGESDSSGAWIKLQILPEELEIFRGLKGEVFETALRNVDRGPIKEVKPEKGPYGQHAKDLILSGFFNSAKVRERFGGDKAYQEWVRTLPCIITGEYGFNENTGEELNEYAHVRRSGESGTAYKPKYSGVPLLSSIHKDQHDHGEAWVIDRNSVNTHGKTPAEWFEAQASNHLKTWMTEVLKYSLGADSMTKVSPDGFREWAVDADLEDEVPNKFKDKYWSE